MAVGGSHSGKADRLSLMPTSLQLHILSYLDARHAVRTLALSKLWLSSWTCIPVLNFNSHGFKNLHVFDKFVLDALSRRQPVKLDRLTFTYAGRTCRPELLQNVFDYAFLHGVQELEADIVDTTSRMEENWPIYAPSDSLTSLKLHSRYNLGFLFLQPRSGGSFKNLTNLRLQRLIIKDLDPFSGFPALDKLTLVCCQVETNGHALNVHAPQLSEFTFFYYYQFINRCEFTTPKLRYFEWGGNGFPQLKGSFPVLDTVVINYNASQNLEKISFDHLLMLFHTFHSVRSLAISAPVVHLLALFLDDKCTSPFRDLMCLKLDFSLRHLYNKSMLFLSQTLELVPGVEAYLLSNSHHAKCTIINRPDAESPCSTSQKLTCQRQTKTRQVGPLAQSRPKRVVKKPTRFLD